MLGPSLSSGHAEAELHAALHHRVRRRPVVERARIAPADLLALGDALLQPERRAVARGPRDREVRQLVGDRVPPGIAVVARPRAEERDAAPLGDGDGPGRLRALVRETGHRREREQIAHDDDARRPRPVDAEVARERVARRGHGVEEERRERAVVLVLPEHLDAARLVPVDRQRGGDALAAVRDVGERLAALGVLAPRGAPGSPRRRRSRARRWPGAPARAGRAGRPRRPAASTRRASS